MISRRSMFGMLAAGAVALASKTRLAESSIALAEPATPSNVFMIKGQGLNLRADDIVSFQISMELAQQYGIPPNLTCRVTEVVDNSAYMRREDEPSYMTED